MTRGPYTAGPKRITALKNHAGFTLVEILIALSVLAVTMAAVFALFSSGLKLRTATREHMGFDRDARLLVNALTDDLANLVPAGPPPLVTEKAIVLWRDNGDEEGGQLVTYQWSVVGSLDSLLVRLATPLSVDPADSAQVHGQFLRWTGSGFGKEGEDPLLQRVDEGRKFGKRAVLKELAGSWVAFPHIRGFALEIPEDITVMNTEDSSSRLIIHLQSQEFAEAVAGPSWMRSELWESATGLGLEATFWIPTGLGTPVHRRDDIEERTS